MYRVLLSLFLLSCIAFSNAQVGATDDGYSWVVSNLPRFQTSDGGFVNDANSEPSLEATENALFLSSLFGLRQRVNPTVVNYVRSLQRSDYGYGQSSLLGSDLETVRHAILSYQHMGVSIPNAANVGNFIKSLYNEKTKLFSNRLGETGDLKSTALAFQTLEYLGELQRAWVPPIMSEMKSYLQQHIVRSSSETHFEFSEETGLAPLSANYYGIVLGSYVGFDFGQGAQLDKWAAHISLQQDGSSGAFFGASGSVSLEATAHAISSLQLLQPKGGESFMVDSVDGEALYNYVRHVPRDIRSAAQAHLAVALCGQFSKNFNISVDYDVFGGSSRDPDRLVLVQGTQVKPVLLITSFDGMPHAGLDVEVSLDSQSLGTIGQTKLQWKDGQGYASEDFFGSTDVVGSATFNFALHCYIVGVGEISLEVDEAVEIGFGMEVDASARLDGSSKEFFPDDTVPFGTQFEFEVTLFNQTHEEIVGGEFAVWMDVLDSSGLALDSQEVDARGNVGEIGFEYTLDAKDVPSGLISFRFSVGQEDGSAHTVETVSYRISVPMVATNVVFDGRAQSRDASSVSSYHLGDTIEVTMEPATLPDLRTARPLPTSDEEGNVIADSREFRLAAVVPGTSKIIRVKGVLASAAGQPSRYRFTLPLTASAAMLGEKNVHFEYVSAEGGVMRLALYDAQYEELVEDPLSFTVDAKLHVDDMVARSEPEDFHYGSVVHYRFRVRDLLSGLYVEESSLATVHLVLTHTAEDGSTYNSLDLPAQMVVAQRSIAYYDIKWTINPNAVQDPGHLSLQLVTPSGAGVPVYDEQDEGEDAPFGFNVQIGGHIHVEETSVTLHENIKDSTVIVSEFTLKCNDVALLDAHLIAAVYRGGDAQERVVGDLHVASTQGGRYSVSASLPHDEMPTGNYSLVFFRAVDVERASQTAAHGLSIAQLESMLQPIFIIPIAHEAPAYSAIPIRPELLLVFALGGTYLFLSSVKSAYVPKRKKVKKY